MAPMHKVLYTMSESDVLPQPSSLCLEVPTFFRKFDSQIAALLKISFRQYVFVLGFVFTSSAHAVLPAVDALTENNAASWGAAAGTGSVSLVNESVRIKVGSKSIHIDAPATYSANAWIPSQRNAHWDMSAVSFIRFWAYIETGNYAFFPDTPRIRLGTTLSDYIELEIQTVLYPNDPPPDTWHEFIVPISGATAWKRTVVGSPNLSDINYLEIFTNTWDFGFDLWLDGLAFLSLSAVEFEPNSLELFETWRFTPTASGTTAIGEVYVPPTMITGWLSSSPSVASVNSEGQVTAKVSGVAQISATAAGMNIALSVEVVQAVLPPEIETVPAALSQPASGSIWEMPVVILRYLPTADGIYLDSSVSPDFYELGEFSLTDIKQKIDLFDGRMKFMLEQGSMFRGYGNALAKPSLGYRVVKYITVYEPLPPGKLYGFDMGRPVYIPDYEGLFSRFDLLNLINSLGIREVWIWSSSFDSSFPSFDPEIHKSINARQFWESNMSSPITGDISNSNRDNFDLPEAGHTYVLYGASFHRTQAEGIHVHGHQLEAILSHTNWLQDGNTDLFWKKFVGQDLNHNFITGRCGWTHMPPNTINHYDYENPAVKMSDCKDWKPTGGAQAPTSVLTWQNINYAWPDAGPIPQKTESQFYIYWMQNMPGYENGVPHGEQVMTNWWYLTADWDAAIASGYGLYGILPPSPVIFRSGFETP